MELSERWLRTYADPPIGSEELAHRLTMTGLEVERSEPVAPPFTGVVVAQVNAVRRHPNADKLTICEVDAGTGNPLTIVCGAPNAAAGIKVPCALAGSVLPGDLRIKPTTMRGVESLNQNIQVAIRALFGTDIGPKHAKDRDAIFLRQVGLLRFQDWLDFS